MLGSHESPIESPESVDRSLSASGARGCDDSAVERLVACVLRRFEGACEQQIACTSSAVKRRSKS